MLQKSFIFKLPAAALFALTVSSGKNAVASTTWDPATPDRVTVSTIDLGNNRYTNVVATFGSVISIGNGAPSHNYDSYDPATGLLTISTIKVGTATYNDVVIAITGVISVGGVTPINATEPSTEIIPTDPLFADQWHLKNTGQTGLDRIDGKIGEDLNISQAWASATGKGIQIAIIDDGLDIHHEDLNVVAGKSWNYITNTYGDPSSAIGSHGTSCAGLAAAKGNNGIGVTGVAYNAKQVGYNLLSVTTSSFDADSVTKDLQSNHIYSNSYGAADNNGLFEPSAEAWQQAIDTGISTGRKGKGVVYTWAAGNGAPEDRSDYDGQANYQGVLAIGSLNDQGTKSSYSEPGSNLLVMAYGGEFCSSHAVTTIDITGIEGSNDGASNHEDYIGQPNYTRCMNGTSAATPEVSGVAALLLEANPALSWRDVRAILTQTARKNDPAHSDWITNGGGFHINHNYGYGVVDAAAAVNSAKAWKNIPAQKTATAFANLTTPLAIADNSAATTSIIKLSNSGINKLEFVDVNITSDHPEVGDLEITLTSPAGTSSTLTTVHDCKLEDITVSCSSSLSEGMRFGVVRLMGEAADGNWTLSVRDGKAYNTGKLIAWNIKTYGY